MGSAIDRFLQNADGQPASQPKPSSTPAADPGAGLIQPVSTTTAAEPPAPSQRLDQWLADSEPDVPLRTALHYSTDMAPDQAAEVLGLRRQTGLPADVVARNLPRVKADAARVALDPVLLQQNTPTLAAWMAQSPHHAAAARDDVEGLGVLEQEVQRVQKKPGFFRNLGRGLGTGLIQGEAAVGHAVEALGETVEGMRSSPMALLGPWYRRVGGVLKRDARENLEFYRPNASSYQDVHGAGDLRDYLAFQLGQGLGSMASVAVGAAAGGPAGGAAVAGTLAFGDVRDELEELGVKGSGIKNAVAAVLAVPIAALDQITPGELAARLAAKGAAEAVIREAAQHGLTRQVTAAILKNGLEEAGTEAAQEAIQYFGTRAATGQPIRAAEAIPRVIDALVGGGLGGGVFGGAAETPRVVEARRRMRFFQALGDVAQHSKFAQQLPDEMQDFVERLTKDGPVEFVYAPVETWTEYWQSKKMDPAAQAKAILGSVDQYVEALQTGGDLAIPTARYAVTIAPTEHNAFFMNELRTSPTDMNAREAQAFVQQLDAQDAETQATAVEQAPSEASAASVAETVTEQLRAAGIDERTAQTYASLYESTFRTLGERAGIDPQSLFERYGLSVQRTDAPSAPTEGGRELNQSSRGPIQQEIPLPPRVNVVHADANRGGLDAVARTGNARDDSKATRKAALAYAKQQFQGSQTLTNAQTGWAVDVAQKSLAHLWSSDASPAHVVAMTHLDDLFRNAVYLAKEAERRGRKEIKAYHWFYAPMQIGEEHYLVRIGVRETNEGQKLYDQLVIENERPAGISYWADSPREENPSAPAVSGPLTSTIGDFLADVNAARDKYDYFQDTRGRIRFGANRQFAIDLFKTADLSTFLHETGHFYLEVLGDLANDPASAAPEIQADYATLLVWLGVETREQIGRDQHEQFARGFEAYLMEGKAPTSALRTAFARFRAWLISVYRRIKSLDVELSPEIRTVFDRMLATDDEIRAAETEQGMAPLFADPAAVGMSEAEAARYRTAVDEAHRAAEEALSAKLMAEVQREQERQWKDARAAVRAEVAGELYRQPVYIALAALQRGTMPDGTALPAELAGVKLSKAALVEAYGEAALKTLPRPYVYSRDGGIHQDQVAGLFGFGSGDELIQAMRAAEPQTKAIERLTDERMRERFGDMLTDGTLPAAAMQSVHNEKRAQLLRTELQHLASANLPALKGMIRAVTRRVPPLEAVRAQAEAVIAAKKVREIQPIVYQRAEARAAKGAVDALLRGAVDAAFDAKQRQWLNHELYRAATDARERVETIVDAMRRFDQSSTRQRLGKAGGPYLEQIDALRERFDFSPNVSLVALDRRTSLREWAEQQRAEGLPVDVPERLLSDAYRQHYKDLTYEELQGIHDTVKQIAHLARLKNKLLASAKARAFEEVQQEVVSSITAHHDVAIEPADLAPNLGARLVKRVRRTIAEHTRMEFLFEWLDGNAPQGPVWQALFKPMAEAENTENTMHRANTEALHRIFSGYSRIERAAWFTKRVHISAAVTPQFSGNFTKANILAVALNWGNEYNRDALMQGYGWTTAQVGKILDHLDARDWQTVQAIWDHLNSFWPEVAALEKELTGLEPAKVEASPVVTKHGTFAGGYYPVIFDAELSTRQSALDEGATVKELFGGEWARAMTRHGHTKTRTNTGGKPLRLELSGLTNHVAGVIHDLAFRRAVIDASRLIHDDQIRAAIEGSVGREMYRQLNPWLVGIAGDRAREHVSDVERIAGRARQGATVVTLGLKLTSAVVQTLGYTVSVKELGLKYAVAGVRDAYANPAKIARQWDFIQERSAMMRDRLTSYDRDIRDYARRAAFVPEEAAWFTFIGYMDLAVSVPTWLGAYRKAMDGAVENAAKGDEHAAVSYADQVVRQTQAAGGAKDLAAVQRGGELRRLFTMFYSSLSVQFNQFAKTTHQFAADRNVPKLLGGLALTWFVPALLEDLLRGRGPDDDENWLAWLLRKELMYPFGAIVLVRDLASGLERYLETGRKDFQATPAAAAGKAVIGAAGFAKHLVVPDDEVTRADVRDAVMTTGYFAKLPARQIWQTGEYFHDWWTGEQAPSNPLEGVWRGLVTGKPRD